MNSDPPSTRPGKRQKLHIRITYPGTAQPERVFADRCETLVRMLVEGDAGVIDERTEGGGAVDIFVVTRFHGHTTDVARKAAAELGLAERTTIRVVAEKANADGH